MFAGQPVEERLRILERAVETMSLGLTIADTNGRILYANPTDARMHGFEPHELLGLPATVYSTGITDPHASPVPEEGKPWVRERLNKAKDGRLFPVRLVSDYVLDSTGKPVATVTICEDVSDRLQAQAAIELRDRVLAAVGFAAARFLSNDPWERSVDQVLLRLQQATSVAATSLVFFCEREEEPPRLWRSGTAGVADLGAAFRAAISAFGSRFAGGQVVQIAVARHLPAAAPAFVALGIEGVTLVPIRVDDRCWGLLSLEERQTGRRWSRGEIEAFRTLATTLGGAIERQKAEEALAASQANYRDIVEGASDLICSVDAAGRFLFVNRAWLELLGHTAAEVARSSLWDVIHPAVRLEGQEAIERLLSGSGPERLDTVLVPAGGGEIAVEGVVSKRADLGRPATVLGIFRDVRERKLIERMKEEFISTVSHELRTPLTSMLGSLGLVRSQRLADQPDRVADLLAIAQRNGERLLKLINDLLDLQRLAAGELNLDLIPIDVDSLIDEALQGIRGMADLTRVSLRRLGRASGARVLSDRDRLGQVLYNLLSNAIKFSPPGEVVSVWTTAANGEVTISVVDNGPGIPEEFKARLFEQFAQASPGGQSTGTGLGLAISKRLVEKLGGAIAIHSSEGSGTTVSLSLPLAPLKS